MHRKLKRLSRNIYRNENASLAPSDDPYGQHNQAEKPEKEDLYLHNLS
jgi:hypothetical protein